VNDQTYTDPKALTTARESRYADYIERRHKRRYPRLYWQPHHGTQPAPPELSQASAVERINAEHRRWVEVVQRDGCCGQGECHGDGWCPLYKAVCPRHEEDQRAIAMCEAIIQFIDSL
jgi:hypothetical protein